MKLPVSWRSPTGLGRRNRDLPMPQQRHCNEASLRHSTVYPFGEEIDALVTPGAVAWHASAP